MTRSSSSMKATIGPAASAKAPVAGIRRRPAPSPGPSGDSRRDARRQRRRNAPPYRPEELLSTTRPPTPRRGSVCRTTDRSAAKQRHGAVVRGDYKADTNHRTKITINPQKTVSLRKFENAKTTETCTEEYGHLLTLLALTLTSLAASAQSVQWDSKVEPVEGNQYRIVLEATIPAGYHMYDMGPYEGGPNATPSPLPRARGLHSKAASSSSRPPTATSTRCSRWRSAPSPARRSSPSA